MRRGDLADLTAFVAVADQLSFRAAATRLGVTPSALSHTMRQLEERIGVRLLNRTTRSVSLTDAGLRLLDRLRPAIDQIDGALEGLNEERQRPFGHLRIHAGHLAAAAVIAPVWSRFLSAYPDVELEIKADQTSPDIVAMGYDAGISTRDRIATDMIATQVTGPLKVAVVGAPSYFAQRGRPRSPSDLVRHSCVQYRKDHDGPMFEWPFTRNGKSQKTSIRGRITVNTPSLAVRAAVDGLGMVYMVEALVEPYLRTGQLVRVLEDWSPILEGFVLYYPSHRQISATLRAFIDLVKASPSLTGSENSAEDLLATIS